MKAENKEYGETLNSNFPRMQQHTECSKTSIQLSFYLPLSANVHEDDNCGF